MSIPQIFGGLEATADHQSSSAPKPPKNYESPTAIPRILEKHKQTECEKSCREDTALESTFENNAQNFQNLQSPTAIPRILEKHKQTECEKSCREQTELESTFSMDSACGLELWIAARVRRLHTPSMRPYTRLQSPNSSSTILESQDPLKSPTNLESTFENNAPFSVIASRDCGANAPAPSLRADSSARHSNSAPAESNQINGACEARNLESVQGDWGVKGGIRGGRFASSPPVPP